MAGSISREENPYIVEEIKINEYLTDSSKKSSPKIDENKSTIKRLSLNSDLAYSLTNTIVTVESLKEELA